MLTLITALALATAPADPAVAEVVSASLFKNGYSMVLRRLPVSGSITTTSAIPQAALGTFWISTTGDLKIQELVATQEEIVDKTKPGSFDEFLALNLGRTVEIQTVNLGVLSGTLYNVQGDIVMLEQEGQMRMISRGEIRMVTVGAAGLSASARKRMERVLRFKTSGIGDILMFGLERGMTWSPAYALDLETERQVTVTAKSTVLNDLADLDNIELKFVTGFPNVPWSTIAEPLLTGQSVDQFTNFLASVGIPDAKFRGRDVMTQNAAPAGAGGFGAADFGGGFEVNTGGGMQAEDLFFYQRPGVTLKRGDRAYYVLFQFKSDYGHLYTVDLTDSVQDNVRYVGTPVGPADVWHSLKLKNNAPQPLTTAPATVFKDGQILGQDTLMYTPTGAQFMVKMSKSLDIRVEVNEEEVKRDRSALRTPNGTVYDLVTLKGTVSLRSFKSLDVDMRIQKELTGEVTASTGNPAVVKLAKGLVEVNPRSRLTWTPNLKAGKTDEFTYTYQVYVNN